MKRPFALYRTAFLSIVLFWWGTRFISLLFFFFQLMINRSSCFISPISYQITGILQPGWLLFHYRAAPLYLSTSSPLTQLQGGWVEQHFGLLMALLFQLCCFCFSSHPWNLWVSLLTTALWRAAWVKLTRCNASVVFFLIQGSLHRCRRLISLPLLPS